MTDLIRISSNKRGSTSVEKIMTKRLIVTSEEESLLDVMNKLVTNDIEQLPVVNHESGKLIGIIDMKDVIRTYDKAVDWESDQQTVTQKGSG